VVRTQRSVNEGTNIYMLFQFVILSISISRCLLTTHLSILPRSYSKTEMSYEHGFDSQCLQRYGYMKCSMCEQAWMCLQTSHHTIAIMLILHM